MAAIFDLYITKGDSFSETFGFGDDMTGTDISIDIYDNNNEAITNAIEWDDITIGEFTLSVTAINTESVIDGVGLYSIRATDGDGTITYLTGNVYIDGGIK